MCYINFTKPYVKTIFVFAVLQKVEKYFQEVERKLHIYIDLSFIDLQSVYSRKKWHKILPPFALIIIFLKKCLSIFSVYS